MRITGASVAVSKAEAIHELVELGWNAKDINQTRRG